MKCAVLLSSSKMVVFTEESINDLRVYYPAFADLIEALSEFGRVSITTNLQMKILDIGVNGYSLGYFAAKSYSSAHGLKHADLISTDEFSLEMMRPFKRLKVVVVPLFGGCDES